MMTPPRILFLLLVLVRSNVSFGTLSSGAAEEACLATNDSGSCRADNTLHAGRRQCKDNHENCPFWAGTGECDENFIYMRTECPMSCEVCVEEEDEASRHYPVGQCKDNHDNCHIWAEVGECDANAIYMREQCPLSCELCVEEEEEDEEESCSDDDDRCSGWAKAGQCNANPTCECLIFTFCAGTGLYSLRASRLNILLAPLVYPLYRYVDDMHEKLQDLHEPNVDSKGFAKWG
jgi:hypothetical protein